MYNVFLSKQAVKDLDKLKTNNLAKKAKKLLEIIKINPYQTPPTYEKLSGDLSGFYSRRINRKHRLVYSISEKDKIVDIHSMWSHYE